MRYLLVIFCCFFISFAHAQIKHYTTEKVYFSQSTANVGDEIDVVFELQIAKDWYVYATEFPAEEPIHAEFHFTPHSSYKLVGKPQSINPKRKFDDTWGADVAYFEKRAEFRQKIKILEPSLKIKGDYLYQCCSNVTGQCIQEKPDFATDENSIKIKIVEKSENKKEKIDKDKEEENPKEEAKNETDKDTATIRKESIDKNAENEPKNTANEPTKKENTDKTKNESLLAFMLLAFLGGFSAILTPCVFPMIPMTVTFFTKNKKKQDTKGMTETEIKALHAKYRRKALQEVGVYALSIIGIYTLLGVFFSAVFGAGFNNWLSTHWIPNLFFFFLLVFFGLSFLGMYEIVLPSSWVNAADRQADKGGYLGIIFMAFTLALVSFSCTAPIVGTLLVAASGGALIKPILGMIAFSTAVALPFALFAAFPTWLNSLPKSGGWLNAVKVTLGFLEIAFALKFLSQADLVYHWGILNRDVFITFWIVIFSFLGFYLLGKIRLPHDSPTEKVGVVRLLVALFAFSFVVYLVPGLFGAPLRPLAGYLPPETTMEWNLSASRQNTTEIPQEAKAPKYSNFLKLPHGLYGFFDIKEAIAHAKEVGKPIFIDFTGHGCVNCREMEARVWSDPQVIKRLKEDYVIVALYVDDRKSVPEKDWYISTFDKKTKKTMGDQNADYQATRYNTNSQPYYCLINANEEKLAEPKQYDLNVDNFIKFLDEGKKAFENKKNVASK